jgi:hypothetical protein
MSLSDALPLPDASPVCGVSRSAGPKQVAWDASDERRGKQACIAELCAGRSLGLVSRN